MENVIDEILTSYGLLCSFIHYLIRSSRAEKVYEKRIVFSNSSKRLALGIPERLSEQLLSLLSFSSRLDLVITTRGTSSCVPGQT